MGSWAWFQYMYPNYSLANISITKTEALDIAQRYLASQRHVDLNPFVQSIVFIVDDQTDRYLQRTLDFRQEMQFLKKHDFEIFFWLVRFFKENKKEEYRLTVSCATGEITGFIHTIDDSDARSYVDVQVAQQKAMDFLRSQFRINFDDYEFSSQITKKYDNRIDYAFTWQKKNAIINWYNPSDPNSLPGKARILMGATVSGDEVLIFSKNKLAVPDQFTRYVKRISDTGRNLFLVFKTFHLLIIAAATFFVILRRNHLVMHQMKRFSIVITAAMFCFNLLYNINDLQGILFQYNSTSSLASFMFRYVLDSIFYSFFTVVATLVICLAGESLHYEVAKSQKEGGILFYLRTTIFTRPVSQRIILGYLIAVIMLGIQAVAFQIGQKYFGVWREQRWLSQISTAYLPFLTTFIIGFNASVFEEITYRLFSISWGKRLFKSAVLASIVSSLIWGFGHSSYPVYPMWFRGLEVTCLGFFLSFIYLRFGLVSVIVAHYLFDVFWSSAPYFLGKSDPVYFYSCMAVLCLPWGVAVVAFVLNRKESECAFVWQLNKHQLFNLNVLNTFLAQKNFHGQQKAEIKKELIDHGWDIAVVETALDDKKS